MLKVYTNGTDKQVTRMIEETEGDRFSNIDGWFSGMKLGFTANHNYEVDKEEYASLSLINFKEVEGIDFIAVAEKLRNVGWEKLPEDQKKMLVTAITNFKCDGVTESGVVLEVKLDLKKIAKNIMERAILMTTGKKRLTDAQWVKLDKDIKRLLGSQLLTKVILLMQELLVMKEMTISDMLMKATLRGSKESGDQ